MLMYALWRLMYANVCIAILSCIKEQKKWKRLISDERAVYRIRKQTLDSWADKF